MVRLRDSEFLPPIRRAAKTGGKRRKRRKRGNGEKIYKKIRSLRTDKCVCGKASVDSVGSCGGNPYCILLLCKAKADIKARRRNRKMQMEQDALPSVFEKFENMESLQRRDRQVKALRAHFSKISYDVVRPLNVCTGVSRDGAYCVSCKCIHVEPKHTWSTGNIVQDNIARRHDAKYDSRKQKAIQKQNKLFVRAAKYLRRRRRRREKKLDLPANTLLKDYTDDGGVEIDNDLRHAVYESLSLQGTDRYSFDASLGELFKS